MKTFLLICACEWKQLTRNYLQLGLIALFVAATLYAVHYGNAVIDRQSATLQYIKQQNAHEQQQLINGLSADTTNAAGLFEWEKAAYPSKVRFFLNYYAIDEPSPFSRLSIGQRDVNAYYLQLNAQNLYLQLFRSEIANPRKLLAGNFDLSFVIIYLLPLLIIAFTYNLLSDEQERGTLPLLRIQPVPLHHIILYKLLFRVCFIMALLLFISCIAFFLSSISFMAAGYMAWWLLICGSYLICWFTLLLLINAFRRSSAINALLSLSTWLLFLIVIPALLNLGFSDESHTDATKLTDYIRRQQGMGESKPEKLKILERFYKGYPQYRNSDTATANRFLEFQAYAAYVTLADAEAKPSVDDYFQRVWNRNRKMGAFHLINPAVNAQYMMNTLGHSGLEDAFAFRESVTVFHRRICDFCFEPLFAGRMMTKADYKQMPVFNKPPASTTAGILLKGLGWLWLLALSTALAGWYRLRKSTLLMLMILFITGMPVVVSAQQRTDSLRQVTVTAARNNLQVENGRITLNVANSPLATGVSVFDLLKKMPGISISQDDNISLRGTEGVNVLIDGKMNYLSGKQLADFLKGLSSDNVVKIELITTPTAEFDAAGNAGFINIVTRRRTIRGYAIDLRSTVTRGSTWMFNENISASINTKQLSLYGSFDYNTPNRKVKSISGNTVLENDTAYRLERLNTSNYHIKFYTWRAGADWRINEHHQFSAHYHGYFDDFAAPKDAVVNRYTATHKLHSTVSTFNNIIEPYHYDAGNLAWTWQIDTTGKKLVTETHFISYRNLSDALMTSVATNGTTGTVAAVNALRSHQPGYITIRSAKTDLEWPHRDIVWKGGIKYAWVSNDNNYRFDSLIGNEYKEATGMSNHFLYNERIAAAYASAARKFNHTSVLVGLRVEHTDAKGYTVKEDFANHWTYTSIFPSLSVDHEIKQHKFNLSLSRRINRPTYSDLNPVRWYTDQYFYYSGNPALVPEMAWLLSGAFTFKHKYILTATYGFRDNYMTKKLTIDTTNNAVKSQTANLSNMQRFDLLFSAPFSAGPWSMQLSAGLNYSRYPIPQKNENSITSRWSANAQLQQQLKLPGGLRFELASYIYSPELWGVYLKDELFFMDAGLRKACLKENLVLQFTFMDVLRTYRLRGSSLSNAANYWYNDRPEAHRISLSVRYHIGGRLSFKRASSIDEQERL